jgi:DNA-binding response OmpR family regulator
MPGSSTIIIARDDLSIPGSEQDRQNRRSTEIEKRFFELIWESRPDVVVLDLSHVKGAKGIEAIRKIRNKCSIPILVVCAEADPHQSEYRIAGAAECMHAPVDILMFNRTIQNIIRLTRQFEINPAQSRIFTFNGMIFRPDQNTLNGQNGSSVKLTTSENDVLRYFLSRIGKACSRTQIAESLYGRHRPTSDRAIDVIINRLRKKLAFVQGRNVQDVVKTEFRRGYMFVAEVSTVSRKGYTREHPSGAE